MSNLEKIKKLTQENEQLKQENEKLKEYLIAFQKGNREDKEVLLKAGERIKELETRVNKLELAIKMLEGTKKEKK